MKKSELLKIANQILKANNYRFEFEQIQLIPKTSLMQRNDIYTMGDLNGCELWYSMAVFPTNYIFSGNKLYQLL